MDILESKGTYVGRPIVECLEKNSKPKIWELRSDKERFTFIVYGKQIVFLTHFRKKTKKAPKKEIEKALKKMQIWLDQEK